MTQPAVVVTGLGVVSPLGIGREAFAEALATGASAVREITSFDPGPRPPRLAALVGDFDAREHLPAPLLRRMDRLSRMIGVGASLALRDAGLRADDVPQIGVVVGTALGNLGESAPFLERVFARGPALASPMLFPNLVMNAPASQIAMAFRWRGPNLTVSAGEISGEAALDAALALIRSGRAPSALVAAGDELSELLFRTWKGLGLLSPRRARREHSSPFDAAANGPVAGEGATAVVLESEASARARGARAYARVAGVERFAVPGADPHRWPSAARPLPLAAAAELVVSGADSSPERDLLELGLLAGLVPAAPVVYALAGALGTHGSAGLANVAVAALALESGRCPPLASFARGRPEFPFVYPRQPIERAFRGALVLGTSRGGAAALVRLEAVRE